MRELYMEYDLLLAMIAVGAATIGFQCIGGWMLWELQKECGRLGKTKQPWLRGIIMKFIACYKLRLPVHNVSCFVDRYLQECRFHRLGLTAWLNVGICGAWVEGILFGVGTVVGVYYRTDIQIFWFYGIDTIVILSLIMGSDFFLQIHARHRVIRIYLVDYLENTLQPRLENHYLHPEEEESYQREYFGAETASGSEEGQTELAEHTKPKERTLEPVGAEISTAQKAQLLDEIMNEYF